MKKHKQEKRRLIRLNKSFFFSVISATAIVVMLIAVQGPAHILELTGKAHADSLPSQVEEQIKQRCHLLDEKSTVALHRGLESTNESDLIKLHAWLKTAHLRPTHQDNSDELVETEEQECAHYRENDFSIN